MSVIAESTILKLVPAASFQSLGDSAVILRSDSGQLYTCNETTEAFLRRLDGKTTIGVIIDSVLDEFEVDRDTLSRDLLGVAADLIAEGIVTSD
jgi:pyrroloquinoline quinone biosynthesis protein D